MSFLVSINGKIIKNLNDFVKAINKKEKFYVFRFMNTPTIAVVKGSDKALNADINASLM